MTTFEAKDILALWKRCPDCALSCLKWQLYGATGWILVCDGGDGGSPAAIRCTVDDATADAIICRALERWLFKTIGGCQIEMYPDGVRVCSITTYTHHRIYTDLRPTKLLALVSACNAILDGMRSAACDEISKDLPQGETK